MRRLELRRHAPRQKGEDRLSEKGQRLAEEVGRTLPGNYTAMFTSPAKRAAETGAWFLRGLGQKLPPTHGVSEGLASALEDRWREAATRARSGRVDDIETVDPDLVEKESTLLGTEVRRLIETIPEDRRGLAIGHSPLIEAAVYGLTGRVIDPLAECDGVLLEERDGEVRVVEEYRRR